MHGRDFLIGGGEMAQRIAEMDWSRTRLGPIDEWPQSLKTATSLMLGSKFAMVVAWGPEFVFLYNDRYQPILGGKHPASLGKAGAEIFPEAWDQIVGPLFHRAVTEEAIALDDILIPLDRNGFLEECYFTLSYSPIRSEGGKVGGLLAVVAETTERVQGERGMRTLRDLAATAGRARTEDQALRDATAVLATNPTDVPFAASYVVTGPEARLVDAYGVEAPPERIALDDAAARWPFPSSAEQPGIVDHGIVLPLTRPGVPRPLGFVVAGTSPRRALDERYRTFFSLAGEHIATAVCNARHAEEMAALDRAKTAFFSNISHEFRTPLTLMLGPTEDALASGGVLSGEALACVHRNELRLLKLVNTLLDFARIEAGRAEACYRPVDLSRLTTDLASAFQSAIERAGLALEVDCPPLDEPTWVDPSMWEKIVLNLLSNALKFTFEGRIRVELRVHGDNVTLRVADTGTGIVEDELPRVFERFHRVRDARSRTHEGSGIGLALVQELVRLHGGTVRVDSQLGVGSTFEVGIPRGNAHLPPDRLDAAPTLASTSLGTDAYTAEAHRWIVDPPAPAQAGGARQRVLVVDDNADMRDYLQRLLAEDHDVATAEDGEEALRAIEAERPDLVVSDVMMPRLDGLGLLRELRVRYPDADRIPVILLTARAGDESRVEGLQAGADDYLVKPFSARELRARVHTQLELVRKRGALAEQVRFTETLNRVSRALNAGLELEGVLQLFTDEATALCGASFGAFFYSVVGPDGKRSTLSTHAGIPGEARSQLTLPVRDPRGELLGGLVFGHPEPGRFHAAHEELLVAVAAQAASAIQNARLYEQSRAASRAKDEFFAMLGHELRNPLMPIKTALHLIGERRPRGIERELSVIGRQVDHMVRLVDDLLDVSRIASGKVELRKHPLEITEVIDAALEATGTLLGQRRHHVRRDIEPGLVVEGDPVRLAQVMTNLLNNAAKYTPPGGEIEITARGEGAFVDLRVRDNGIGITEEMLPRVFELFSQERQTLARAEGGLGLGLTIVRSLVALHGGTVWASSEGRGHGTELTIRLPRLAVLPRPCAPVAAPVAQNGGSLRVLVVDDNVDAAELLAEAVRHMGHDTAVAFDGAEAIQVAAGFLPQIALLDIGLPSMDGYELATRLAQAGAPPPKMVAISGYGLEADRQRSKDVGFSEHVIKPIHLETLREILARCML